MFKKEMVKLKNKNIIFTILLFLSFLFLVYLFPYSGDDWAWGSYIGLDRLSSNFENYNGRYAGNLLVICLTRSKVLDIVIIAGSLVCCCLFPKIFSNSNSLTPYVFGTLLLLLIPKQIFIQSIVWTAGYSNYVPPIILIFLYFIIIKNIFEDKTPHYNWTTSVLVACIGFLAALFMENVTLYNIAVSVLIIIFVFFKFKKIYFTHVAYLIGSVLGAVLMFSNTAYTSIANNEDSYRSTAINEGLVETIGEQTQVIIKQFFTTNFMVLLILTVFCVTIYCLYASRSNNKKLKNFGLLLILINVISFIFLISKNIFPAWAFEVGKFDSDKVTTIIFALISAACFCSASVIVLISVNSDSIKYKTLLLLISVPILIAPLTIVKPIGPRCFFPPYLMLIGACVLLFVYICDSLKIHAEVKKGMAVSMIAGCLAMLAFFFSVYSTIHKYDLKRNIYVEKQIDAGYDTVTVCKLPYTSYVWVGDPDKEPWDYRYKLFYGVDEDVEFVFLQHKSFDKWVKAFDEEVKRQ